MATGKRLSKSLHGRFPVSVENLEVTAEVQDEVQGPGGGRETGPVGGREASDAADVRIRSKVEKLRSHLKSWNESGLTLWCI